MGPNKGHLVQASPEALLTLLNPIVAMPNSEELLGSQPVLELLSSHIDPVMQS